MKVFDFINHASIKVTHGGFTLVTDPWYVSNAFGSWYQSPGPRSSDVYNLIDTDDEMGIIVSHGHDDHLDEFFITNHLLPRVFFCPKFATPGLEHRLTKRCGVQTEAIGEGKTFGPFTINQFINPDFTEHDAVITIKTKDFVVIHANDNWHPWPEDLRQQIGKLIGDYEEEQIFLLIQFGIADCFPLNYPQYNDDAVRQIVSDRFDSYTTHTLSNMTALGLGHIYYYANQSKYDYFSKAFDSLYDEALNHMASLEDPRMLQLTPGTSVHTGHQVVSSSTQSIDMFSFRLKSLENFLNEKFARVTEEEGFIKTKLIASEEELDETCVNYLTDVPTWNRILSGELTLESIIIGGSGRIFKPDLGANIKAHHMFISKQSYVIQNKIRATGISFFREQLSPETMTLAARTRN